MPELTTVALLKPSAVDRSAVRDTAVSAVDGRNSFQAVNDELAAKCAYRLTAEIPESFHMYSERRAK